MISTVTPQAVCTPPRRFAQIVPRVIHRLGCARARAFPIVKQRPSISGVNPRSAASSVGGVSHTGVRAPALASVSRIGGHAVVDRAYRARQNRLTTATPGGANACLPHDLLAEQSALGGMMLSQGRRRRRHRDRARRRLLHAEARGRLRRDPHALLARRADRRHRRHRRAHQDRRAAARGWRRVPAHPHEPRADGRERRLLRVDRRRAALLRRLVEAGTRIVQMGYAGEGEVTDLVNNAQAEIYGSPARSRPKTTCRSPRRSPPRSTRSRRPSAPTARSPACPPASPTSTT